MNYYVVGKFVVCTVAGFGAEKIVTNIVKFTTPATIGVISKVAVKVGGVVIGMYVGGKMSKYANVQIDKGVALVKKTVEDARIKLSEKSKV